MAGWRKVVVLGWAVLAGVAMGAGPPPARNFAQTSAYFARVASDPSREAELELLATMLPKGGDLHHHYSGAHYAETYLEWMGREGWCVQPDTLRIERTAPAGASSAGGGQAGASSAGAAAGACASADQVLKDESLYRRLLMRWSDKDYANHGHDQPPPDQQFFDTFGYFSPVSGFAPHEGLELLKRRAQAENVQYLETMLRSAPAPARLDETGALDLLAPDAPSTLLDPAFATAFRALERDDATQEAVRKFKAEAATDAAGLDGDGFALRFQAYVSRNAPASVVFGGLYAAFKAVQGDPLIVGVNIVGPENGAVAMRDYALHMHMFRFLHGRFPGTHLSLHAGELAVGMVPPEGLRFHVRMAVEEAGAERIGHGVDIAHEDDAWKLLASMKRRGTAVEINLTSNDFILGVSGDRHPVSLYRRAGVPIVISTDDAGVSRSSLSHEYALFVSRYRPTYRQLKTIVYDSLRYSFLTPEDRQAQLRELDRRFAAFEARVAGAHALR